MRFSTRHATRWTPLIICFLLISESCTDHNTFRDHATHHHLYHPLSFQQTSELYPRTSSSDHLRRFKRQPDPDPDPDLPDFSWKPTKTPKFVTTKEDKHPLPILRVYPPDVLYRSGRSRDLQQPQGRTNIGRRIIYYATLPDLPPRAPTNVAPPLDNRYVHYPMPMPPMVVSNQQRSYNPMKGGKDFVTKVSSSVIGIRPSGDKKDSINSTPTFTIIDAHPTPYSGGYAGVSPYNRVHVDYNMIGHVGDRPNFNYIPSYYNPTHPKNQYELISPQYNKAQYAPMAYYPPTPYYGNIDKTQYHPLAQYTPYQHQSSPYLYGNDVNKLPAPYHNPPYPSRHTRFPSDRYPIPSPLSEYNLGPPASPPANLRPAHQDFNDHSSFQQLPNLKPVHQDFNDHNNNLNSLQQLPNLKPSLDLNDNSLNQGLDGPSPTLSSSLDFNGNLDHNLDSDDNNNLGSGGSSLKDKFPADYNTLGQKYFDFNSFNNEFPPLKNDLKDAFNKEPFKFDKEPFKGAFSQVSDWLTNKPFDLTGLDMDDVNANNRDYQIKGSAHFLDTQMVNQNLTQTVKDSNNNTVITPFTISNATNNLQTEERTNR